MTTTSKKYMGCLCVLVLFVGTVGNAQRIDSLLVAQEPYQPERLYLHLDRSFYNKGDTVWFQGYLTQGMFPSPLSKTVYVDVFDGAGQNIQHMMFPVLGQGIVDGQFSVPFSLGSDIVTVQAYTKWMLNFDSAFLFRRQVHIGIPLEADPPKEKGAARLQLFPEGGRLVSGVENTVAFKASDDNGNPLSVSGTLFDGQPLQEMHTTHDGLGKFRFTPLPGRNYSISWHGDRGDTSTTSLRGILDAGIVLHVSQDGQGGRYTVRRSGNAPDSLRFLYLTATLYGKAVYMAHVNLKSSDSVSGFVPTAGFPAGILQYTLFDKNWTPVAERIAYTYKTVESQLPIDVGFRRLDTLSHGLNEISLTLPDSMATVLSVSITDAALPSGGEKDNILSYFLLTGDLRGRVCSPARYLHDTTAASTEAVDLLMMTHGWRRVDWHSVLGNAIPVGSYTADSSYHFLKGRVLGIKGDEVQKYGALVLSMQPLGREDGTAAYHRRNGVLPLTPDGGFGDATWIYYDSVSVSYRFSADKGTEKLKVQFCDDRIPTYAPLYREVGMKTAIHRSGSARATTSDTLLARFRPQQRGKDVLEGVLVATQKKAVEEQLKERYTSGMFVHAEGFVLDVEGSPIKATYGNILAFLKGRVPGFMAKTYPPSPTDHFYLDEAPVDKETLATIPVSDIAMVMVMHRSFLGPDRQLGGIAIYRKKPGDNIHEDRDGPPGLERTKLVGYSPVREFHAPEYKTTNDEYAVRDNRATLLWKPCIQMAGREPVLLGFYNNDFTRSFRVVIEGMASDGRFLHFEKIF
ncbi:MAG: hypothetical protein QM610_10295 [Chitinophagaceae bacterium]